MKRKTFIHRLTLGYGALTLLPGISLLGGCQYQPKIRSSLTDVDIPFLNELAEIFLPQTDELPGAKAAQVGNYILLMYLDCMKVADQELLLKGINELDARSAHTFSTSFIKATAVQKLELLETVQEEALIDQEPHYFNLLKNLTISGYFTSKIGMTEARNYVAVPGKFEPCIPYQTGDKPWAI